MRMVSSHKQCKYGSSGAVQWVSSTGTVLVGKEALSHDAWSNNIFHAEEAMAAYSNNSLK